MFVTTLDILIGHISLALVLSPVGDMLYFLDRKVLLLEIRFHRKRAWAVANIDPKFALW